MRPLLIAIALSVLAIGVPHFALAAGTSFLGPIVPNACNCVTGAGWGCVLAVIQNIINFAIAIGIFGAVAAIAYAGFLWILNPINAEYRKQASAMLLDSVVGLVIALAAFLIVNTLFTTLTNTTVTQATAFLGQASGNCLPAGGANSGTYAGSGTNGVTAGLGAATSACPTGQSCQTSGFCGPAQSTCGSNTCTTNQVCDANNACVGAQQCTIPATGGAIPAAICSAASAYQGTNTSAGPAGGTEACAWAMNNVLAKAGISNIGGNSVSGVESALQGGRGTVEQQSSAVCGDIVIEAGDGHVGICLNAGCSSVISNSSSHATFSWISGPDFSPSYSDGIGRFYRVNN